MKNKLAGLLTAMLFSFALVQGANPTDSLAADWQGTLDVGAVKLRLVLKIAQTPDRGLTAALYSIDQTPNAIPAEVTRDADAITLDVKAVQAGFKGTLDAAGNALVGQWTQRGNSLPLTLTRVGPDNPPFKVAEPPPVDLAASKSAAEKIAGVWNGTLVAGPQALRLRVTIQKADSGAATGTMDSLDQGANGILLNLITLKDDKVRFEVRTVGGVYEGALSADGSLLKGEWSQGGQTLPLELKKAEEAVGSKR